MDYNRKAILLHKKLLGKIFISSKIPIRDKDILSSVYTPGVGAVSLKIAKEKNLVWELTGRRNTIAIVTDGSAVLGLGNVGPEAALPVMEGKAALFSEFGGVNAYPLCVKVSSPDEVVNLIRAITPTVGGINLEDIKAPECFEIEQKLADLGIPVFHDDQDGTAIVVTAALINAAKVTGKALRKLRVVIMGAGAAGSATTWFLVGREKWNAQKKMNSFFDLPQDIILVDSSGIINERRADLSVWKKMLASVTNKEKRSGGIEQALQGADVMIGLSSKGKLTPKLLSLMNKNPIVFALSNPIPEIMPNLAYKSGAMLVATGRSDFPNQVNNALVFPGFFRGLLDSRATQVTSSVKIVAVKALIDSVNPTKNKIMPSVLEKKVHMRLAQAVKKEASR